MKTKIKGNGKNRLDFKTVRGLTHNGNYSTDIELKRVEATIKDFQKEYNLDLDVDFQRGHVWSKEQQSKFIEYLLRGGKTTPILFNHPNWMTSFEGDMVIVDGKQRVTAIIDFFNDKVEVFGGYRYSEIDNLVTGCRYTIQIKVNNLQTRKEVLRWYLELNTGGTPHTKEEILKVENMLCDETLKD